MNSSSELFIFAHLIWIKLTSLALIFGCLMSVILSLNLFLITSYLLSFASLIWLVIIAGLYYIKRKEEHVNRSAKKSQIKMAKKQ